MGTNILNFISFEEEEQSAVRVIQDYFNSIKQLVSLEETNDLLYNKYSPYIVCKFVRIYEPLDTTKKWLSLICQEVKSNDENDEGLFFRTYFYNNNALLINDAIKAKNILAGDLLVIHVFKVAITPSLPVNKFIIDFNIRLMVEVNESNVYIWKLKRFSHLEDCTKKLNYEYKHISVFSLSDSTNKECEIKNLLRLVEGKGNVVPMREVPKKSVNNPILIAELIKMNEQNESSIYTTGTTIQVEFKEVFLKTNISYGQGFVAFFFGEFAEELQLALEMKDVAVGDFVALCDPTIDKYTAPVHIHFPHEGRNNLIVLQCRHNNNAMSSLLPKTVDVSQFRYLNNNSERGSKLLKNSVALKYRQPDKVNVYVSASNIEHLDGYVLFVKVENSKEELMQDLWNLKNDQYIHYNEEEDDAPSYAIVVTQLMKAPTSLTTIRGIPSIVLHLKEIQFNCQYGASLIVILHNEVAESFFYSLKNGFVLKKDVIVIEHFFLQANPQYFKEQINNEKFFIDVGASKQFRTRIVVFKLDLSPLKNSVNICKTPEQKSCTQGTKMTTTSEMKRTSGWSASPSKIMRMDPPLEKQHNCDELYVNQVQNLPENSNPTVSESGDLHRKDEHITLSSKRFANECSLVLPEDVIEEQQDFLIYPMSITKPCLEENFMNLVQGQCSLSCGNVVTFSSIVCNAFKEPLCPKCLTRLKLFFSFEMEAYIMGTRQLLNVVLEGNKAEKFLGVNCNMFFINEETQKLVKINIQDKVGNTMKVCNLKLKDVSSFTFIK